MTGSRIVGPALAGLLIHTVGYGWCFLVDGLSYLAVIAGLWLMRTEPSCGPAPVTARAKGQVRAGLRYVRRVPDLWIPLVMMAIVGTLAFNFQVGHPAVRQRDLRRQRRHVHPALLGASASARWPARWPRPGARSVAIRHVVVGAAAFGVSMLVFAAAPTLALRLPDRPAAWAAPASPFMTASTAIVQIRADPRCGAGCWPCRPWCSSAARRSAARSSARSARRSAPAPAWSWAGHRGAGAGLYGLYASAHRTDLEARRPHARQRRRCRLCRRCRRRRCRWVLRLARRVELGIGVLRERLAHGLGRAVAP